MTEWQNSQPTRRRFSAPVLRRSPVMACPGRVNLARRLVSICSRSPGHGHSKRLTDSRDATGQRDRPRRARQRETVACAIPSSAGPRHGRQGPDGPRGDRAGGARRDHDARASPLRPLGAGPRAGRGEQAGEAPTRPSPWISSARSTMGASRIRQRAPPWTFRRRSRRHSSTGWRAAAPSWRRPASESAGIRRGFGRSPGRPVSTS